MQQKIAVAQKYVEAPNELLTTVVTILEQAGQLT
jgi:hypothetical protein